MLRFRGSLQTLKRAVLASMSGLEESNVVLSHVLVAFRSGSTIVEQAFLGIAQPGPGKTNLSMTSHVAETKIMN